MFGEAMIQRLVRTAKPSVTAQAGRDQQGSVRLIVKRREIRLNRASEMARWESSGALWQICGDKKVEER